MKICVIEDAGKSGGKIPSSWAVADTILGGFIGFNVGAIAGALIGVDIAYGGFGIGSAIGAGLLVGTITIAEYFDVMPNNFHIFGITSGEFSAGLDFKKRQDEYAIDLTQYYKSLEEIKQQKITYEDSDVSFEREKAEIIEAKIDESLYLQDNIEKQEIEVEKYSQELKAIELTNIGDDVVDFATLMERFTNRQKDEYGLKYGTTEEPCKYIENGCYARAEIIVDVLKKNGFSAVYEYINIKGEGWNFHVVVLVTLSKEKFYIDPGLSDKPLQYYNKQTRKNEMYEAIRNHKTYGGTPKSLIISDTNYYYDRKKIPQNKRLEYSIDILKLIK